MYTYVGLRANSLQSCPTLWDPMDCSPPGSSVHGILQARILGVGYHFLLQGFFLTQGLNPCLFSLLQWQAGSLQQYPLGSPCIHILSFFLDFLFHIGHHRVWVVFLVLYCRFLLVIYFIHSSVYIGEGNGIPLQYSCLENPMDEGAWGAAVHGVAKSWTQLSNFTFTFHFHALQKEMATHSSVLAWRIPGTGSPVGCCLWVRTESDTTEVT